MFLRKEYREVGILVYGLAVPFITDLFTSTNYHLWLSVDTYKFAPRLKHDFTFQSIDT